MTGVVKEFIEALKSAENNKTSPYDVKGEVRRIEGKTAWVRLNGGIDETPVEKTIACEPGDIVRVRVGGGGAWIVGNESAPPTDDKAANRAMSAARSAGDAAGRAQETADGAQKDADDINRMIDNGELTIDHVDIEYCLSTTKNTFTQYGSWSTSLPEYASGYYYYTRTATYYDDGSVVYSTPVYDLGNQVAAEAKIAAATAQGAAETAQGVADDALALAGAKKRVFNTTPTPPYDIGDLWFDGVHGSTYICNTARTTGQSYSSSHWTLYSTDVSNHFWYDSSGAHIAENQGDVSTGASQTISSNGTVMMRNGRLVTSWTGSSSSDAALNFYDCTRAAANAADLIASYSRAGITQYINNRMAMALTSSGLSFYDPDQQNATLEAVFGSTGAQFYVGGVLGAQVNSDGLEVFKSNDSVALFGTDARIGVSSGTSVDVRIEGGGSVPGLFLYHDGSVIGGITAGQIPTAQTDMDSIVIMAGGRSYCYPEIRLNSNMIRLEMSHDYGVSTYRARMYIYPGTGTGKGTFEFESDNFNLDTGGDMEITGDIKVKGHTGHIGEKIDVYLASAKSLTDNTFTNLISITLTAGTWVILAGARFAGNDTGTRWMNLTTSSGNTSLELTQRAVANAVTQMREVLIRKLASTTTFYLNVKQNSGGAINALASGEEYGNFITAVRIA